MLIFQESFLELHPRITEHLETLNNSETMPQIVLSAFVLGILLASTIVEELLSFRGKVSHPWPVCPKCGCRIESKGLIDRQLKTIIGLISWKRRVGRCSKGCHISQIVPSDERLGLTPNQITCYSLKKTGCLLAVFLPFETASLLLQQLLGISVSSMSVWHWVQESGKIAILDLERQLKDLQQGSLPPQELLSEEITALNLIMGADGVMVPFRPFEKTPKGKTKWREVKVGILARLKNITTKVGNIFSRLSQRRVVAVLGDTEQLKSRLILEAWIQQVTHAPKVIWISDGARGLWNVYFTGFSLYAIGILDFYHASQNLWKAAKAWMDGRTEKAKKWFKNARHKMRHGQFGEVFTELSDAQQNANITDEAKKKLLQVINYLDKNQEHMDYEHLKGLGIPIGSGFVESTCKWLIQQRFKGVGMRWSVNGFNHLLHLRVAWVNQRFDLFFPT